MPQTSANLREIATTFERKYAKAYNLTSLFVLFLCAPLIIIPLLYLPSSWMLFLFIVGLVLFALVIGRLSLHFIKKHIQAELAHKLQALSIKLDELAHYCNEKEAKYPLMHHILKPLITNNITETYD